MATKIVDGVRVEMSDAELAAFQKAQADAQTEITQRVPKTLSAGQLRVAFKRAGLLPQIAAEIQKLGAKNEIKLLIEHEHKFRRSGQVIQHLQTELSLSDEQIDDIFRDGATVKG